MFAACIAAAPTASASDFFVNGQVGQIELDSNGFDEERSNYSQGSIGYRWGLGMAAIGLEAGIGKLDDQDNRSRTVYTDGFVDHDYTLSSRNAFIGASARVKPPMVPFYLMGRAGYLGMERKLHHTATDHYLDTAPVTERNTFKENDGGTYAGVGIGTTILPLLDIGLMYNQYRYAQLQYDPANDEYRLSDYKRDARSVTFSVEYRF